MAELFNSKAFNPEAFKYSVDRVPNLKQNEIQKSGVIVGNSDIKNVFATQNGTEYAVIAMRGLLEGDAVNYDGQTDIAATSTKTFQQGVIVVGRAKGFIEKDFSYDITGGVDFMDNVASQVAEYKNGIDENHLLSILKGMFRMTGAKNEEFVKKHTTVVNGNMAPTTLNSATNKACGANKKKFALVFMHSDVATNLENLNLIEHLKYTDKDGITREIDLYSWGGKLVVVDDDLPVSDGYFDATSETEGALKVVASGASDGEITLANANKKYVGEKILAANDYVVEKPYYITYVLGKGSIFGVDVGVKVPYEMDRDPARNGGEDTLYIRRRKCYAPFGISYTKASQTSLSPTDEELENGANWSIVHSGETNENDRSYINHKAIPIVRIISQG